MSAIDIWETEYLQILDGKNAVAEWTKGSVLKPLLDALEMMRRRRSMISTLRAWRPSIPSAPTARRCTPSAACSWLLADDLAEDAQPPPPQVGER